MREFLRAAPSIVQGTTERNPGKQNKTDWTESCKNSIEMRFTHVLFPFDYSDECRHAAQCVKNLIQKTGSQLTILNVIGDPGANYPASAAFLIPQRERDEIVAASTRFLREYASKAFEGCPANLVCQMGDPAREIIRFAAENQVDLIMMPTAGCGHFRRLLLGSITAKVLDEANCAVWTDAHLAENGGVPQPARQSILCAVDEKDESVAIMRGASDIAKMYSAELHLIHAIPEFDPSLKMLRPEWFHDFRESAKAKIAQKRTQAGIDAEICVQEGAVSTVVRQAALGYNARLVVIGRGRVQSFLGRLRTNAYAIIRDSPCPVLSV
jgi:nucleotide-binding universal stress UspA family protein